MQFTKIADVENTEDDNSDPVHGTDVMLANYIAPATENNVIFNLGGITRERYSKIWIEASFLVTGALDLQLQLNGITTSSYFTNIERTLGTTQTYVELGTATQFVVASASILTVNTIFASGDIEIPMAMRDDNSLVVYSRFVSSLTDYEKTSSFSNANSINGINQIILKTSANNWGTGTRFTVYARKRQ